MALELIAKHPIIAVITALGLLITIIRKVIENWDEIKKTAWNVLETITQALGNFLVWIEETLWPGLKDAAKNGINWILEQIESGINWAIGTVESFVNMIIDGINSLIGGLSQAAELIPGVDGLGKIGHVSFGRVALPRLATGTVVPPGAGEFAAILGDNNTDTEVVSPLETMKEAFLEALDARDDNRQIVIRFDGSLSELARILKPEIDREGRRLGTTVVIE